MSDNLEKVELPTERHPVLSDAPTESELVELLDLLVNWEGFARYLPGITEATIKEIKQQELDSGRRKKALFSKFLLVPKASWQQIVIALLKVDEYALASAVLQNYAVKKDAPTETIKGKM